MKKLVDSFPKIDDRARVPGAHRARHRPAARRRDAVENSLRQYGRDYHASQAAAVVADLDGAVRAMVGGRDYGASQFNRATDALRQPGSSFKPYVYATALMNGFEADLDRGRRPDLHRQLVPAELRPLLRRLDDADHRRSPTRSTPSRCGCRSRSATATPEARPRQDRRRPRRSMGLRTPLLDTPSLPIGAAEVTVLDHTVAYAAFPNVGMAVAPHAVLEVRTGNGEVVWRFDRDGPKPRQVMPRAGRARHEHDDEQGCRGRHRPPRPARRRAHRRQDRHHQRLPRRVVRRLLPATWSAACGSATTTTARPTA